MADTTNPITVVPEDACWGYLASQEVGRLVTSVGNRPELFPVNFVLDGQSVVFRTAEGSKLAQIVTNDDVAFQCDGWDDEGGWSVLLHGTAEVISDEAELARCEKMPLRPWVPTVKPHWVRLNPSEIVGRTFIFGRLPE